MTAKLLIQYYGILLGVLALLVHNLLLLFPYTFINKIYTDGLYPIFKWLLLPLQWLPFPSLYLIVGILIIYTILGMLRFIQSDRPKPVRAAIRRILNVIGLLVFFFYLSWAFNYRSLNIQDRLQLSDLKVEEHDFKELYEDITRELIRCRNELTESTIQEGTDDLQKVSAHIDSLERHWLSGLDYPIQIPAKVKPLFPGTLLRISTAGFYFPFGGEGYYDGGLHPLTIPFVIAHELAHNYGVTDEGEANFVAFHTCLQSNNNFIRYSALLDFWRYLAATYRRMEPEAFEARRDDIPESIWEDLRSIRQQHEKFPDILPGLRDQIYNMYLHSQGVKEGMGSYARIIELELAYRKQYPSRK